MRARTCVRACASCILLCGHALVHAWKHARVGLSVSVHNVPDICARVCASARARLCDCVDDCALRQEANPRCVQQIKRIQGWSESDLFTSEISVVHVYGLTGSGAFGKAWRGDGYR
eukprot:2601056-Pleurochrysis_carterae.AAC.2